MVTLVATADLDTIERLLAGAKRRNKITLTRLDRLERSLVAHKEEGDDGGSEGRD